MASPAIGSIYKGQKTAGAIAARTAAAAVVGGVTSVLGGGKFKNGAVTTAMQHLFNAEGLLKRKLARHGSKKSVNLIGEAIEALSLESDLEKELFRRFWLGKGNYHLSRDEFRLIVDYASTIRPNSAQVMFAATGQRVTARQYSFYGNESLDEALGTATIFFNGPKAIGFYDRYNFDPKDWGVRSFSAELATRLVNQASSQTSKPFSVTYGVHVIP